MRSYILLFVRFTFALLWKELLSPVKSDWFQRWMQVFDPDSKVIEMTSFLLTMLSFVLLMRFFWASAKGLKSKRSGPPLNAEFLFYLFLDAQNCDALVGDLEERYHLIQKKFGKRRADLWYWKQTITSVGPIAWAWAKKSFAKPFVAVAGWAIAKGILGHDSWLAALVEVWRRIRS